MISSTSTDCPDESIEGVGSPSDDDNSNVIMEDEESSDEE